MSDLSLISTDDLFEELVNRFDHLVISGIKYTKSDGEYMVMRKWSGNRHTCLGLLTVLSQKIANKEIENSPPMLGEDR